MAARVRVMVESGKKKRVVACAFDWPGWDRSARHGHDVLAVLERYRPRYAKVAALAGLGAEFAAAGDLDVVERVDGIGAHKVVQEAKDAGVWVHGGGVERRRASVVATDGPLV